MSTTKVSPTPVVTVAIDGDTVTVDGERVEHDGTRDVHEVAVHTVARNVAQPLNRPVRTTATDHNGETRLVVHPDGHTEEVESPTDDHANNKRPASKAAPQSLAPEPAAHEFTESDTSSNDANELDSTTWGRVAGGVLSGERGGTSRGAHPGARAESPANDQPVNDANPHNGDPGKHAVHRRSEESRQTHSFLSPQDDDDPATQGLRGLLGRIGLRSGPSEAEKRERSEIRSISRHWPGPRTIAVVNGKGGANKTPTTIVLAALFARNGGTGCLAWDHNDTRGTLGWRTEQGPHTASVLDLLPATDDLMRPDARAADLAAYVHHQTADKYDVLRSNPALLANDLRLTPETFDAVHRVATKYYRLTFIDSGNDESQPHWLRMIDRADQLVMATTTRPDHAEAGRLLLDSLRDRDTQSAELADNAVVIVSQADREEAAAETIAGGYDGLAREAVTIPYDQGMRSPWLRSAALAPSTWRAYRKAAAAIADGL